MKTRRGVLRLASVALGALLLVGRLAPAFAEPPPTRLTVFAAASLQEVFRGLEPAFEAAHPGVDVVFSFAGSQELRMQLEHGAPADVFASADEALFAPLQSANLVQAPVTFATNRLVLVVSAARKATLTRFEALPTATRIVLGAPEVPVGRYAGQALERMGGDFRARVEARVVSRELNVRQVLAKVKLGEADAGVVYATDARAAGDAVGVVAVPDAAQVLARYGVAVRTRSAAPEAAREWVTLLTGPTGQKALSAAGFGAPAP
jgi:molybdate transport system substrate-binding protein